MNLTSQLAQVLKSLCSMHSIRFAFALLTLIVAVSVTRMAGQQDRTVTVQLLAINDFHGHLDPPAGTIGVVNGIPAGGAEYLATHLRNAARQNPNSIIVAAGD